MGAELTDKTCLVTGANRGIGAAVACGLAERGGRVLLVCRDPIKGQRAAARIVRRFGTGRAEALHADLASQGAVRQLAKQVMEQHSRLDLLVHNAAVIPPRHELSPDGLEMQFAVNHLAPFLLTNLLLPYLVARAPARIVVTTSDAERKGRIALEDLHKAQAYSPLAAYAQSKLANVLFTYELARRLAGTAVTANCVHPGVVATGLLADFEQRPRRSVRALIDRLRYGGPRKGARAVLAVACDPALNGVSGLYFRDGIPAQSCAASYDTVLAARLWEESARLVRLRAEGR